MTRKRIPAMRDYLQSCGTDFWQQIFRAELDYLLRYLKGSRDILSIGCGPAIIEAGLSEQGFNVTGLDISPEALACAPTSVRTIMVRAEEMAFADSCFDAAIYVTTLQFLDDYVKVLEATTRTLRPKGRLIVMLLNPESAFFEKRASTPDSYVRNIKHTDLTKIEETITKNFQIQTEYFLGVRGVEIFESQDPLEAALYVIRGIRKSVREHQQS